MIVPQIVEKSFFGMRRVTKLGAMIMIPFLRKSLALVWRHAMSAYVCRGSGAPPILNPASTPSRFLE
jgi:hypothetical protein